MKSQIILTCEHGGNKIPFQYSHFFGPKTKVALNSHRGWDIGALKVAKNLEKHLQVDLIYSDVSRLLVDLNRSEKSKSLFSEFSRNIPDKTQLLEQSYFPYRKRVEESINGAVEKSCRVFHFSIHSFTPILNGTLRNCEIGLLYDPSRFVERNLCRKLQALLRTEFPNLRIRLNYPYKGIEDGFPTKLRKVHSPKMYCGVELELNQSWLQRNSSQNFGKKLAVIIGESCNEV